VLSLQQYTHTGPAAATLTLGGTLSCAQTLATENQDFTGPGTCSPANAAIEVVVLADKLHEAQKQQGPAGEAGPSR
jgi:hypothetical protein